MVHVLVAFQAFVFGHPHGAPPANAAQVVSEQIHDHGKFRIIFGAAAQIPPQLCVLLRRLTTFPGAFDGPGFDGGTLTKQEPLHGRGQDLVVPGLNESIERGRVERIEMFPQVEGIPFKREAETLRQVYLVDIPGPDVLTNPLDRFDVGVMGEIAGERPQSQGGRGCRLS